MSRGRSARINITLLGNDEAAVRCPRVLRVGLDFGDCSPLVYVRELLEACGFSDEQEARHALALPQEPCVCPGRDPAPSPAPVVSLLANDALYQALRACRPLHCLVLRPAAAGALDPRQPYASTRALRRTGVLRMTASDFRNVYRELIDENPLAIRAVLKVLCVEFTDTVPTLAVTCEQRPRLLVNLAFVRQHCRTEAHVKAVTRQTTAFTCALVRQC